MRQRAIADLQQLPDGEFFKQLSFGMREFIPVAGETFTDSGGGVCH